MTLVLAGGYAGWVGSLAPEVADQRPRLCLRLADLPPDQLVDVMAPTMFAESASSERVQEFVASMYEFHQAGFHAMAHSTAEADLPDVLPHIDVPVLLLYADKDVRPPLHVAEHLRVAIHSSRLIIMQSVGHLSSVEAAERFNSEVRAFLRTSARHPTSVALSGRGP